MKKQPKAEVRSTGEKKARKQEDNTRPLKTADLLQRIHELQANLFERQKQNEKLEQTLAEAKEAYRQYTDLYDFAPVGYFTLGRDGAIRQVNLFGANLLGAERDELIDQQLSKFAPTASRQAFDEFFESLLTKNGRETCELTLDKYGDGHIWVRIEATCFEGGLECRAVMLDISERKQMESELRISAIKYKTLFDSFPLGITVSDEMGNILETNLTAEKLLGVPQEEHIRRGINSPEWKIVRPDDSRMPPEEFASVRALKENTQIENLEMGVVKPDTTTWISVTAAPLRLDGYGVVVTYGDITERIQAERELLESERRAQKNAALLRSVMESPQGIVIFALDTSFCYTAFTLTHKNVMKTLWGVEIEIGMNMLDVIGNPLDREKARGNFERVLNGEQFILIEEYGDTTKQRTWYEDRYSPIIDEAGAITGVTVFVTDITERKQAEQAARENQELFTLFMNHSPIYAYIKEVTPKESRVLQASNNYQEMLGIPSAEMVGKTMQELFPPELAASITADDWNVVATGQVLKVDEELNGHNYSSIKFPLVLGGKALLAGYSMDVTERTRAEKALQESEHRFRSMIQEVQTIAVQGYGVDGTIQYWNTASEKLYGYSAEEAIGKSILDLIIPPEMRSDVRQAIQQMEQTGQPIPAAELSLMRKDGSHVTVYSSHAVVPIPGLPTELFCLDVDLTESKRTASLMNARVRISEYADTHNLDDLLQKALDEAEALTGSQIGFAHFLKEDQKTLHLQMWSTNTLAHMCTAEGKGSHYPVEQAGVWAECIFTREPVIHNDYVNLPASRRKGLPAGHAPVVRELIVPILRNDMVVMIMGVGNKAHDYDDNDVKAMTQLASSVWDIVQRKQAEEVVRETQELLTLFIKHSPIYTFIKEVTATESRVLQASNNFHRMLGIESVDMIGKTMQELFPPDLAAKFITDDWGVIVKGQTLEVDEDLNGHHYNTVKFPLIVGNKTLLAGYTIDITERVDAQNALQASEANLRAIFDNSSQAFQVIDRDRRIQSFNRFANSNAKIIFGKEMHLGDSIYEFVFPQDRKGFDLNFELALSGEVRQVEKMFKVGNEIWWFEFTFAPIRTEHEVIGICFSSQNITERKQAETILQESELLVKGVLNSLTAHIAVLDEQGVIVSVNDAWINFARKNGNPDSDGFVGKSYLAACEAAIRGGDRFAIEVDQAIRAVLDGTLAEFSTEYPFASPKQTLWFTITVLPQHKPRMGAIVMHQDITERKTAEEERREASSYNRRLIEASIDPLVTIGPDGKITDANEATETVTGLSRDQLIGEDFLNYFTEPDKAREGYQKALAEGVVKDYPLTIRHTSGKTTAVLYNVSVYKNKDGEVQGVFAAARDVTELKKAEQEIVAASLELQTALLREKELARTDVLTGVNNRRHLYQQAEHEFQVAMRYQQTLSVIMFDIDHFKGVNDTFGHEAGDQILRLVTDTATAELRSADVIGRYGGEEFIVILPMTNAQQAFQLAERIRLNVAKLSLSTSRGEASVTLSIGIVELGQSLPAESVEDIFRRADAAMYAAKQAGRNQTIIR